MKSFKEILTENTVADDLQVGGKIFHIQRIRDCEPLLESMTDQEFDDEERVPYWAELWPSSLGLAEYILEKRHLFRAKSLIEIGCGLGLSGMAAHLAGAEVLFTDYDAHALEYTKINFFRNFGSPAQVKILDWRNNSIAAKFDVLIAADVLYEKRWLQPVMNTIKRMVHPGGMVYLAEPGRSIATGFFAMADDAGWTVKKYNKQIQFESSTRNVDIYEIKIC